MPQCASECSQEIIETEISTAKANFEAMTEILGTSEKGSTSE
jgi:hypothetical protein